MKILIVEDETALQQIIADYLKKEGFICEIASTFQEADDKIELYEYDTLLLDIGLPDGDGLKILDRLKELHPETGVLIVSAKRCS